METDNKRPNAALINREWFESACKVLNPEDLGRLLIAVVEYVLDGSEPTRLKSTASVVFTMVRGALDSDIAKYLERCARNAANAKSQRQRVVANGTKSQPVVANTTTTPTTTPTTTKISLRESDRLREIEVEKWLVFGYFWATGSKAIKEETNAFWNYYESLGWKNNKGAPIVSKLAAARNWRRQFETGSAPDGASAWYKAVETCDVPDYNIWLCYAGAEKNDAGAIVRLRCKASFLESVRGKLPALEKTLQSLWKVPAVQFVTLEG